MQIQNFLVTMTLAATSAAVPAYKRGSDLATVCAPLFFENWVWQS